MVNYEEVERKLDEYLNSESGRRYLEIEPNTRYEAWWKVTCMTNILMLGELRKLSQSGVSKGPKLKLLRRRM